MRQAKIQCYGADELHLDEEFDYSGDLHMEIYIPPGVAESVFLSREAATELRRQLDDALSKPNAEENDNG